MRIVSFLGSATEIVSALGLQHLLVGISHECDYPPEVLHLPRVSRPRFDAVGMTSAEIDAAVHRCMVEFGSVYEVDLPLLAELRPTHVLTQAVCEVCAVPTGSVEEAVADLDASVEVLSLDAHTLGGILDSIHAVATMADAPDRAIAAEDGLRGRLRRVREAVAGAEPPRVLMLEWLDPPFAPGHWVPEMVEAAGGENLVGTPGERSLQIAWESIGGRGPDVLMIEPCGYDLAAAGADADRHRHRLLEVAAGAVLENRAWVLDSAFFSRSGPRVVDGVEALARIFHPSRFPDPPGAAIARRWTPATPSSRE